jgi:hypothetical protein
MNIFSKLKSQQADQTQADLGSYYKLLGEIDVDCPTDKQAKQLESFLAKLDKTPTQAESDRAVIVEVQQIIKRAMDTVNADKIYTSTGATLIKALDAKQKGIASLSKAASNAQVEKTAAFDALQAHGQARGKLIELRDNETILFAALVNDEMRATLKLK